MKRLIRAAGLAAIVATAVFGGSTAGAPCDRTAYGKLVL